MVRSGEVQKGLGIPVSAKGADVMPAWGMAPGIRLSEYPSTESATQFKRVSSIPKYSAHRNQHRGLGCNANE